MVFCWGGGGGDSPNGIRPFPADWLPLAAGSSVIEHNFFFFFFFAFTAKSLGKERAYTQAFNCYYIATGDSCLHALCVQSTILVDWVITLHKRLDGAATPSGWQLSVRVSPLSFPKLFVDNVKGNVKQTTHPPITILLQSLPPALTHVTSSPFSARHWLSLQRRRHDFLKHVTLMTSPLRSILAFFGSCGSGHPTAA